MSSSITLPLNPSLHLTPHLLFPVSLSIFSSPKLSSRSLANSFICRSLNPSSNDREEIRWLREEQRWLREEERWIREEQRWGRERDSLMQEIAELKMQIQALERQNSMLGGSVSNVAGLLQVLKEKNLIAESGAAVSRLLFDESTREEDVEVEKKAIVEEVIEKKAIVEEVIEKKAIVEEVFKFSDESKAEKEVKNERKSLRIGSEGADVLAMQVCSPYAFLLSNIRRRVLSFMLLLFL